MATVQTSNTDTTDATVADAAPPADEPQSWPRTTFGVVLFVGWAFLTYVWLGSTVYLAAHGHYTAVITAVCAVAVLLLLGGMEGLEVSVIDRWQTVWPDKTESYLARWLSARQLFVALIVVLATLLANRSVIVVPGTSVKFANGVILGTFELVWVTLTVLWFAQIFWKHLGAMNPDRYLGLLQRPLFPIVSVVHKCGISQPGEWTAHFVESRLDWPASIEELMAGQPDRPLTHAEVWRALRSRRGPAKSGGTQPAQ
jgi:hypothetical protein